MRRGRVTLAHRLMYIERRGPIPDGQDVCHKCDTPWCVNPDHLFLGTHKENMTDMVEKGRRNHVLGERHPIAKLTEAAVIEIKTSGATQKEMASKYGVCMATISHVRTGRNWAWLRPGPV